MFILVGKWPAGQNQEEEEEEKNDLQKRSNLDLYQFVLCIQNMKNFYANTWGCWLYKDTYKDAYMYV